MPSVRRRKKEANPFFITKLFPLYYSHPSSQKTAVDRKVSRSKNKPAFLTKKKKSTTSTLNDDNNPSSREDQTALIREFHSLEKRLAAPQTTEVEKIELRKRQIELGGLETYQKASLHGAEKQRGGETSKWLIKQLKQFKVGLEDSNSTSTKGKEKVEPTILEDGTKLWPKPKERRKVNFCLSQLASLLSRVCILTKDVKFTAEIT
jgi:hypothetical protein